MVHSVITVPILSGLPIFKTGISIGVVGIIFTDVVVVVPIPVCSRNLLITRHSWIFITLCAFWWWRLISLQLLALLSPRLLPVDAVVVKLGVLTEFPAPVTGIQDGYMELRNCRTFLVRISYRSGIMLVFQLPSHCATGIKISSTVCSDSPILQQNLILITRT